MWALGCGDTLLIRGSRCRGARPPTHQAYLPCNCQKPITSKPMRLSKKMSLSISVLFSLWTQGFEMWRTSAIRTGNNIKGLTSSEHGVPAWQWRQQSHRGTHETPDGDPGRQSSCCVTSPSAARPCPSRIFSMFLEDPVSLQSGSTTELFVFPNASGDAPAVLGLGKFMWPVFLECRFYLVEEILRITLISK